MLAILCLGIAIHQAMVLAPLLRDGIRTEAVIVGFDVGVKGGKKPILQFTSRAGKQEQRRDLFQMMLFRFGSGERVTVVYDRVDPGLVTIDLGAWTWQQPVFMFLGFLLLAVLFIVLPRFHSGEPNP